MLLRAALLAALSVPLAACVDDAAQVAVINQDVLVVDGPTTCAEQGLGNREFGIVDPAHGRYLIDDANYVDLLFVYDVPTVFAFSGSLRMDGVLVTGGGKTAVWDLGGEQNGWPSLHAPTVSGEEPPAPESITFCYDYELFVNPNAYAKYARQHTWDVAKTGVDWSLTLAEGQTYLAAYDVTVTLTAVSDAGYQISGPVFVNNPTPYPTTLTGVDVMVGEIVAEVGCPVTFPWTIPANSTLACDYRAIVPDTADRLVVATAHAEGELGDASGSELGSFGSHTTGLELVDECVKVMDARVPYGFLGTVCADEGVKTFHYTAPIGPFAVCGPFEVENVAVIEGLDTGTTDSASWTVGGEIPCDDGCTLTPGYWKTHSEHGPAPYDATWAELADGADTTFFLSGVSYHTALWTPPQGNAYWQLAHAYIAAELNELNDASLAAVQGTFDAATALLQAYTPADVARAPRNVRQQFVSLASVLDGYNNGLLGPGHCDE